MKNRLEIAKLLLMSDGVIAIQCDNKEDSYLKVLCDEVFGRENFINNVALKSSTPSGLKTAHRTKTIIKLKDTILFYKIGEISIKPQYQEVHEWDTHFNLFFDRNKNEVYSLKDIIVKEDIYSKATPQKEYSLDNEEFNKFVYENANNIFQTGKSMPEDIRKLSLSPENKNKPIRYDSQASEQFAYNGRRMSFLSNSIKEVLIDGELEKRIAKLVGDFWDDIDFNNSQNEGGVSLPSGKKPEKLLYRIIDMFTSKDDIVLDFFLGSGTTTAVAHKMNRKYIGIEQMDYIKTKTLKRLDNVIKGEQGGISKSVNWNGGGSFVYCELLENSQELIDEIQNANEEKIKTLKDIIYNDSRIVPYLTKEELEKVDSEFQDMNLKEKKKALCLLIDKNKLYMNLSDINDENYNIKSEDKKFTKSFYKEEV